MSTESFRFPLDRLLELREDVERQRALGLARARRDATGKRDAKEDLQSLHDQGRAHLQEAQGAGGNVGHLLNLGRVVEQIDSHLQSARNAEKEAEVEVARQLQRFKEAVKDRRALDRLRERQEETWNEEVSRREQADMDEIALNRHVRPDPLTGSGGEG